jgi:hypothetical protein
MRQSRSTKFFVYAPRQARLRRKIDNARLQVFAKSQLRNDEKVEEDLYDIEKGWAKDTERFAAQIQEAMLSTPARDLHLREGSDEFAEGDNVLYGSELVMSTAEQQARFYPTLAKTI